MIFQNFRRYSISCMVALLIIGCNNDNCVNPKNTLPLNCVDYLWAFKLHKDGISSNSIIRANLVFNDGMILATTNGIENRFISFVDTHTGIEKWNWNDIYQPPTEYFDIRHFYQFSNIFTYQVGSRSYYINLEDGSTYLKIRRDVSFDSELTSFGDDIYFLSGFPQDTMTHLRATVGYRANILIGEFEEFLYPYYDTTYIPVTLRLGDVTAIQPIRENGIRYLIVVYQQQVADYPAMFQSYLGLYNYDAMSWTYQREVLNEPIQNGVLLADPAILDDMIFMNIGKDIVACSIWTGDVLWRRSFTQDFLFSGILAVDGKVLGNCEDTYLYSLNPLTGGILWKEKTAGTSSRLRYLNGIIYLSGGSTSRIHAIDSDAGETVWLLDPAKYDNGSDDFKPDLYVIPGENGEKGKVIIQTHNTAYCVEAYR